MPKRNHSLDDPRTCAAFNNAPESAKADLLLALEWARDTLRDHEGSGHDFQLHAEDGHQFTCSFAKPSWNADHCSDKMDEAPHAVVLAVCEYLNGL